MKDVCETRKWYVLIAKPRAEKQVSHRLTEAGIENYLPLQRQLRYWHDRKKWIDVPLFFSYIFVKTEERQRTKVFEVGGVMKYMMNNGQVAVLTEGEIEQIRCLCTWFGEIAVEQGILRAGDKVEVLTGHFKGLQGQLLNDSNRKRLRITITGLGCVVTVELNEEAIRKI